MVALATRLAGCYPNPPGGDLWLEYVAAGPKVSAWSRPESQAGVSSRVTPSSQTPTHPFVWESTLFLFQELSVQTFRHLLLDLSFRSFLMAPTPKLASRKVPLTLQVMALLYSKSSNHPPCFSGSPQKGPSGPTGPVPLWPHQPHFLPPIPSAPATVSLLLLPNQHQAPLAPGPLH